MATNPITRELISMYWSMLRTDGGTQSRAEIDYDVVDEYQEAMLAGAKFPPLMAVYDGKCYWLVDGFHRLEAAKRADVAQIDVEVTQGTVELARWLSCGVNAVHGLKRSNGDKRRAVLFALQHPKAQGMSDRMIADHCGVSHLFVANLRREVAPGANGSQLAPGGNRCHLPNCHPMTPGPTGNGCQLPPGGNGYHLEARIGRDGKTYPANKPAPLPLLIPDASGLYSYDTATCLEHADGAGVVDALIWVLQLGKHIWASAYEIRVPEALNYAEAHLGRNCDVYPSQEEAIQAAAIRAAARIRLTRTKATITAPQHRQLAGVVAWLAEHGAPPDIGVPGVGAPLAEDASELRPYEDVAGEPDPDESVNPEDGGWPVANENGVYWDDPRIERLTSDTCQGAQALIELLQLAPSRRDGMERWAYAIEVTTAGGGRSSPLSDSDVAPCRESAIESAAMEIARCLRERPSPSQKEQKQIAALMKWAVSMGADAGALEAEDRRAEQRVMEQYQSDAQALGMELLDFVDPRPPSERRREYDWRRFGQALWDAAAEDAEIAEAVMRIDSAIAHLEIVRAFIREKGPRKEGGNGIHAA